MRELERLAAAEKERGASGPVSASTRERKRGEEESKTQDGLGDDNFFFSGTVPHRPSQPTSLDTDEKNDLAALEPDLPSGRRTRAQARADRRQARRRAGGDKPGRPHGKSLRFFFLFQPRLSLLPSFLLRSRFRALSLGDFYLKEGLLT